MKKGAIQKSRELLVQSVYMHLMSDISEEDTVRWFEADIKKVDSSHFKGNLHLFFANKDKFRDEIEKLSKRAISEIHYIDMALLFVALAEKLSEKTPIGVIINEAIELAKLFGSENSYKFVNGALDQLVNQ